MDERDEEGAVERLLGTILEEGTKSLWKRVGERALMRGVETLVVEGIKAQISIWTKIRTVRKRREFDLAWDAEMKRDDDQEALEDDDE